MIRKGQSASVRNRKGRRGISISVKLFAFLALFVAFMLVVIWVFQIGLLNYFYEKTKNEELSRLDESIQRLLDAQDEELSQKITEYATDYRICTHIYTINGSMRGHLASAEVSADCIIHNVPDIYLTDLCERAEENGGLYVRSFSTPGRYPFEDWFPDRVPPNIPKTMNTANERAANAWETETEKEPSLSRPTFLNKEQMRVNTVYVRLYQATSGQQYAIMLNSEMMPLNATVQTLEMQFWMIAVILLIGALLLAILISRHISRPIVQMNEAAKRLAKGNYKAGFTVNGYREVMELSDSLTNASEELSKNDALQKELISNISHDLRTPLTMIVGYGEAMRDLPGENTPENVQVIIDETKRLSDLVNDLLDLSKLQAGTRKPVMEPFNLTDLIRETMGRYEKLIQKDGYHVEFQYDAPVYIRADKTMILQVIYNLINNAINYTGEDRRVLVRQELRANGKVRVSVTDSGEGIQPDHIPLIWDRYYKVDKVHRRAMVGTGLGLSIVKSVLEQHGDAYGVESRVGRGSTFWFEFSVIPAPTDKT